MSGGLGHSTTARGRGGARRRVQRAVAAVAGGLAAAALLSGCSGQGGVPAGDTSGTASVTEAAWPTATAGAPKAFVLWRAPWYFKGQREQASVGQTFKVSDGASDPALTFTVTRIRPDQSCPAVNYAPEPGYRTVVLELSYEIRSDADVQMHPEGPWFADGGGLKEPEMVNVRTYESHDCLGRWSVPLEMRRGEPVDGAIMLQVPERADRLILAPTGDPKRVWEYSLPAPPAG